jgi:hypothetical protein
MTILVQFERELTRSVNFSHLDLTMGVSPACERLGATETVGGDPGDGVEPLAGEGVGDVVGDGPVIDEVDEQPAIC